MMLKFTTMLQDPHGELTGQNVLIVRGSLEKTAEEFKMEVSQAKELLAGCSEELYRERQKRPKPHRDDKILTSWNGEGVQSVCTSNKKAGHSQTKFHPTTTI